MSCYSRNKNILLYIRWSAWVGFLRVCRLSQVSTLNCPCMWTWVWTAARPCWPCYGLAIMAAAFIAHRLEDANCFFAEPHWIEHVVVEDGLKQVILIIRFKWWLARHHLVHEHTQGPPVHWWPILQLLQDLCVKQQVKIFILNSPFYSGQSHISEKRRYRIKVINV